MTYVTLVRSLLKYSATIWNPQLAKDKGVLEAVKRRAARWIQSNYSSRSSVIPSLIEDLGLDPIEIEAQATTAPDSDVHGTVALTPADLGLLPGDNRTRTTHIHELRHQRSTTKELIAALLHSTNRTITEWNRLNSCLPGRGWLIGDLQANAPNDPKLNLNTYV